MGFPFGLFGPGGASASGSGQGQPASQVQAANPFQFLGQGSPFANLFGGSVGASGGSSNGTAAPANPWSQMAASISAAANANAASSRAPAAPAVQASGSASRTGPNPWAPAESATSVDQVYKSQLEQLESMGFINKKANVHALLRCNGNVDDAVEALIEDMSKD